MSLNLLAVGADAKTPKGEKRGYLTGILYLAPHRLSGNHNLCPFATPGCIKTCLNTAGRGVYKETQTARIRKTRLFFDNRELFMQYLWEDFRALKRRAEYRGLEPVVRLNGTSDLPWELIDSNTVTIRSSLGWRDTSREFMMDQTLTFYDYTKNPKRYANYLDGKFPNNYHLVFSRSECNARDVQRFLKRGGNVAVVFSTQKGQRLPRKYLGVRVIDGDVNDLRFKDPKGVVVGLRAKGKARRDTSGFVIQVSKKGAR